MILRYEPRPSRRNDRTFTTEALADACARVTVEDTAFACACTEALHVDAWSWPEFQAVVRNWWPLAVGHDPTDDRFRADLASALTALRMRVVAVNETEVEAERLWAEA